MLVPLSVKPEVLIVEVAAHTGKPLLTVSTCPGVAEMASLESALVPEEYKMSPVV